MCCVAGLRRQNGDGLVKFGAGTRRMAGHFFGASQQPRWVPLRDNFPTPTTGAGVPEKAPPTGTAAVHTAFVGWFDPPGGVHGRCGATVAAMGPQGPFLPRT